MSAPESPPAAPTTPAHLSKLGAGWWALAGTICTSGVWVFALVCGLALVGSSVSLADVTPLPVVSLVLGWGAALSGLLAGAFVGLLWGGHQRFTFAALLGLLGALTGVIGGGLSAPLVAFFGDALHPVASSALAWALAGGVVGLIGCNWARWARLPEPPTDEEAEADIVSPAPRRIEWLLRQQERRISDWPLFRVLPVLTVSACALVGAAIFSATDKAIALAAVGALGLAVALVMQVQESRLRNLDARLRKLERRFRGAPEDEA